MPEPNSIKLPGSGTVPVVVVLVRRAGLRAQHRERFRGNGAHLVLDGSTGNPAKCSLPGVLIPVNRVAAGDAGILQVQPVGAAVKSRTIEGRALVAYVEITKLIKCN